MSLKAGIFNPLFIEVFRSVLMVASCFSYSIVHYLNQIQFLYNSGICNFDVLCICSHISQKRSLQFRLLYFVFGIQYIHSCPVPWPAAGLTQLAVYETSAYLQTSQSCVSKQPVGIVVCAILLHLIELEDEENLTKRSWQCCGERFTTLPLSPFGVSGIRLISSCSVALILLFYSIFSLPPSSISPVFLVFPSDVVYTVSHFLQVSLTFNFPLKELSSPLFILLCDVLAANSLDLLLPPPPLYLSFCRSF